MRKQFDLGVCPEGDPYNSPSTCTRYSLQHPVRVFSNLQRNVPYITSSFILSLVYIHRDYHVSQTVLFCLQYKQQFNLFSQSSDHWVSVHNLRTINDGGILDPDDQLNDVVDDREQVSSLVDRSIIKRKGVLQTWLKDKIPPLYSVCKQKSNLCAQKKMEDSSTKYLPCKLHCTIFIHSLKAPAQNDNIIKRFIIMVYFCPYMQYKSS